jgi:hypothetical protein
MAPESLIIFDYSGTLSIGAPRFAEAGHLAAELAACGLAALGIDRPGIFWDEIVLPTWEEGSTTAIGYVTLIETRIRERRRRDGSVEPDAGKIREAAASFVKRYLDDSVIHPAWEPVLGRLNILPGVLTVIATDHYAEATDAIISHLKDRRLQGTALRDVIRRERSRDGIIVANSADLGVSKADRRFWEIVRRYLPLGAICRILLVDDFGAHEQAEDAYGNLDRVVVRRQTTRDMLNDIFHVPVTVLDFHDATAEPSTPPRNAFAALVNKTTIAIEDYLNHEPFQGQSHQ